MAGWPTTRVTLLERLRDPKDHKAWEDFRAMYEPLIYGFARKRLPQDADAADVTQAVLMAVARGSYDHRKGRFHKWLLTVTLNEIRDFFHQCSRRVQAAGDRNLDEQPDAVEEEWEQDHQRCLFERAAALVRAESDPLHWQAFWLAAVEDKTGKEVSDAVGLSITNVYSAKSRILARIKEVIQQFEDP